MAAGGGAAWNEALAQVGSGTVVRFGARAERVGNQREGDAQPDGQGDVQGVARDAQPDQVTSRLRDALRLAAEAGVPSVRVISDLRFSDVSQSLALLDRTAMRADFAPVGGAVRNAGVGDFDLDVTGRSGAAQVEVFGSEAQGDSATIELLADETAVASLRVVLPVTGSSVRRTLEFTAAVGQEWVRYRARVTLAGDAFEEDDERVRYVRGDELEGGLVLLSLRPDWEPKFLLPTLRDVTGYPAEAFLSIGNGRYSRVRARVNDNDAPAVGSAVVDSAAVRRRVLAADIVVLHGADASDAWVDSWLDRLGRVIVLSPDAGTALRVGLPADPARSGEWFAEEQAPPSAVGASLAGIGFEELPPLSGVLAPTDLGGWSTVVRVQQQRTGSPTPALVVGTRGGRRVVVATARDWWRWAFQGPEGRDAYRRLWSGVAAWVMEGSVTPQGEDVEPTIRTQPRAVPVDWRAAGRTGSQVALQITQGTQAYVDTVVQIDSTERFQTPVLEPGEYSYRAAVDGDTLTGRFDVARWVPELRIPVADLESALAGAGSRAQISVSGGRRLRTSPIPYLVLIGVLAIEWLMRRRRGLR